MENLMEHLENNIIKQKLESLDTLPENYEVNLASKFDLVMQANPKPKKNLVLWLSIPISIAASILVVFLFGELQLSKGKSASLAIVQNQISLPFNNSANQISLGYPTRPKLKEKQKVKTNSTSKSLKPVEQSKDIALVASSHLITDSLISIPQVFAQEVPKKNKKSRFKDLDFNDQILPVNLALESKKEIHFFKVKLPEAQLVNSIQGERALSYRQTF